MKEAISGPNCIDPLICHADCCHIMIDVPKILAEYYIERGYARKEDFSRGNLFSFQINVSASNSKCVFYDSNLNGCVLHKTMYKPPQCWIYPTGFSSEPGEEKKMAGDGTIACKVSAGWLIVDNEKIQSAKNLFNEYVVFCEREYQRETTKEKLNSRLEPIFELLGECSPKSIAGVIDGWDTFSILKAEGISLKLKAYCEQVSDGACNCDYMECKNVCDEIVDMIRRELLNDIYSFSIEQGPKSSYSFLELWKKTKYPRHNSI
jgi:Fe-S-cluster containining protein